MTKIETITTEIEHCAECPNVLSWYDTGKKEPRCGKRKRIVCDLWGEIPTWCPLPDKEGK